MAPIFFPMMYVSFEQQVHYVLFHCANIICAQISVRKAAENKL